MFLRTLAREGMLPTYGELDGSSRYAGGAYAYLMGSAYLEWLEATHGRGTLKDLWLRMSSRQIRSFEEAFIGVYGEAPDELYGRFTAELTRDALAVEEVLPERATLWAELSGAVGPVAIDSTHERAAAVVSTRKRTRLVVWELAPDAEAAERFTERVEETLARDPLDVAPQPPESYAPKKVGTRTRRVPRAASPAFLADGTVLFTGFQADGSGRVRTDLYTWDPETGRERRITHGADLRDASPEGGTRSAVAVQNTYGLTSLVRVNLDTGEQDIVVPGTGRTVFGSPSVSPDGRWLAYAAHRGTGWQVELRDMQTGTTTVLDRPDGTTAFSPRFSPDGQHVLATLSRDGLLEAWRFPVDGTAGEALASPPGGAIGPVQTPDGDLIYASLRSDGFDLFRGPLAPLAELPEPPRNLAVRPDAPEDVPEIARRGLPPASRYGLGRFVARPVIGGVGAAGTSTGVIGLNVNDLIDRHHLLVMGGLRAEHGIDALSAAYQTRAIPVVDIGVHGVITREVYEATRIERGGAELTLSHTEALPAGEWSLAVSGLVDDTLASEGDGLRTVGSGTASLRMRGRQNGALGLGLMIRRDFGLTDAQGWGRTRLGADVVWGRSFQVAVHGERGFTSGEAEIDRFWLGGLDTGLLTDTMQANRVYSGAFAPASATGSQVGRLRVEARTFFAAFAERTWLWDDPEDSGAFTSVGLSFDQDVPEVSLVGVPDGALEMGVACRLESPSDGFDDHPCQAIDDYAIWIGLSWRP